MSFDTEKNALFAIVVLRSMAFVGMTHFVMSLLFWSFYVNSTLRHQSIDWIMLLHALPSIILLSGFSIAWFDARRKTKTALKLLLGCLLFAGVTFFVETSCEHYQINGALMHYQKTWSCLRIGDIQYYCNWWWYKQRVPYEFITDPNLQYQYGYIDKKGDISIAAQYESAGDFSEGLADVKQNGKYGYIDTSGNIIIPFSFDDAKPFHEGLAVVKIGDEYVFIDKTGKVVLDRKYKYINGFSEGLASVEINDKWGHINRQGEVTIEPNYIYAGDFHEGLAAVCREKLYGYIDKNEKYVIEPKYSKAFSFSEGLALVSVDGKWGYINRDGEWIIEPHYDQAGSFSDGLAYVEYIKDKWGYRWKYGCHFIDPNGLIQKRLDYRVGNFSEGLAPIKLNDKFGFVNKDGRFGIGPRFDSVGPFNEGLAVYGFKVKQENSATH